MFRSHRHRGARRAGVLVALAGLIATAALPISGGPAQAQATPSAVRDWNLHAVNALINGPTATIPGVGQSPAVSMLHLAMVQGAVYDAVNAIDGGHQPYLDGLPVASASASQDAAVATAAHDVLVGMVLVPPLPQVVRDRLDGLYADALAAIPDGQAKTDGIAAGAAAAAAMLAARANDGRYGPFRFTPGEDPGEWRPTPPAFVNDPFAWLAKVDPFLLDSPSQFQTKGPHPVTSRTYAREYNEVKTLGAVDSERDVDQQAVADFFTAHPIELFNRAFRVIAEERGLTLVEEARLFAMVNLAGADSVINCWNDKAFFSFWRPITAIHEGDDDGNPRTTGDAGWMPFVANTPPYPDHTSGYNCVTGGMMHAARAFFGSNRMNFTLATPGMERTYARFTDVVVDTIDARVYQGIHFRTADVQGAQIGKNVAHWLDMHYLQPVD